MKSLFKQTLISVAVLVAAAPVYALPEFSSAFIGAEGLYLWPQNDDVSYVTALSSTKAVSLAPEWGWRVYGGAKFTENDDLTLSWMELNTSDKSSRVLSDAGLSTPRWLIPSSWDSATGKATFNLIDSYGVWGHTIKFNNQWDLRFAGGLEFARLNSKLAVTGDIDTVSPQGFEAKSIARGIGPRVEADVIYHLPCHFALFGNVNGALLVSERYLSLNSINTDALSFDYEFATRHIVIPKMGVRLGGSYSYGWGMTSDTGMPYSANTLTVDIGWQAETYIHAVERPDVVAPTPFARNLTAPPSSSNFSKTTTSNFTDQGLFLGVSLSTYLF